MNEDVTSLSYTADIRATHFIRKGNRSFILAEPPPDAGFSYDSDDDIILSLMNIGKGGSEAAEASDGSEDLPMTGRSPSVVLARELLYRVAEMAANTDATYEQYMAAYTASLKVIEEVAKIEAQNSKRQETMTITTAANATLNYSETHQGAPPLPAVTPPAPPKTPDNTPPAVPPPTDPNTPKS